MPPSVTAGELLDPVMHLVGYFEGIDSDARRPGYRRCSAFPQSSYGSFYGWKAGDRVPDQCPGQSTGPATRLPTMLERPHGRSSTGLLALIAEAGPGSSTGERIGVDASHHGGGNGGAGGNIVPELMTWRGLPGDAWPRRWRQDQRHRRLICGGTAELHLARRGPSSVKSFRSSRTRVCSTSSKSDRRGQDRQDRRTARPISAYIARAFRARGSGHRRGGGRRARTRPTRATRRYRWRRSLAAGPRRISVATWTRHRRRRRPGRR